MRADFAVTGGRIFDGAGLLSGQALVLCDGVIAAILPEAEVAGLARVEAGGRLVVPGFVDLQVNGGGGVQFNNAPTSEAIARICAAHAAFGTTSVMVTLITDGPAVWRQAVAAAEVAARQGIAGYLGLHLEGPHLAPARQGTHDGALIRRMEAEDLAALCAVVGRVGAGLITLAPESVTPAQVRDLRAAGFVISLGHSDADAATVADYVAAGASMVTHLFNAMRPLGSREPGMVGAALAMGALSCGLIADGHHVDPEVMGIALRAKRGPGRIFLVTDAMATIGSDLDGFTLNERAVFRRGGRLTLADGTLAGADIDMLSCLRFVHQRLGLPLAEAINMASLYPAEAIGARDKGRLAVGKAADFLILTEDLQLQSTWIGGRLVHDAAGFAR